jgi:hypothetical protein
MSRTFLFLAMTASLGLVSCATVSKVGTGSMAFVKSTGKHVSTLSQLAINTIRPPRVKIVKVRENELKKLPTGQERALAFENTRKRGFFSFFSGPVDFKEPTLPAPGGEMDGSLLPPKEN